MATDIKKVVLAYSGGLDTSIILKWIKEEYDAEVVTYTADVGQGEEVEEARLKALETGATEAICEDLTDEFVTDYVFPAFRASSLYEGYYHMGTSLARPVISKGLVRAAIETGADAIAHGATGKGNDQVRFELSAYALKPDIKVIAPWREWDLKGRADLVAYAERHDIPIPVTPQKPYSTDANLLHISYEGGVLEDPWNSPPEDMFTMTVSPEDAPDEPEFVTIGYEAGDPVSIDGVGMSPVEILTKANELGGRHGIGRVDIVENRFVGMKSRGVYETPGGTILYEAHKALEQLCLERDLYHYKQQVALRYAELTYNGQWFHPLREAMQAFVDESNKVVTGTVKVKLNKGRAQAVSAESVPEGCDDTVASAVVARFERFEHNISDRVGISVVDRSPGSSPVADDTFECPADIPSRVVDAF